MSRARPGGTSRRARLRLPRLLPRERPASFDEVVETWLPLTYALNAVNRSMGATVR